jgi:hypothetical protein
VLEAKLVVWVCEELGVDLVELLRLSRLILPLILYDTPNMRGSVLSASLLLVFLAE